MGSSFSSLNGEANGSAIGPSLGDIPESCVACVFLHLTPPEICNLARLNRAFRGAASSDSVWEKKLPRNYKDLLDLLPLERYQSLSKKDIFALLSRPVPFDDDGQEASCEYYLADKGGEQMGGEHKGVEFWRDYVVGEFVVGCSEPATEVRWSMKQIDCTHLKGGICVDSVFIIPTDVKQRNKRKAAVK